MASPTNAEELRKELAEAHLHLDELTRQLDESIGVEEAEGQTVAAELERARARVVELESAAKRLETPGN